MLTHNHVFSLADPEAIGSSPRIRPSLASSNVPIHSSPTISTAALSSSANAVSQPRTNRSPTFNLPTRSLVVHGLTAGPNGPVSEVQLNTAFQRFGAILVSSLDHLALTSLAFQYSSPSFISSYSMFKCALQAVQRS